VEHFAALPWQDIPAFMQELRDVQGIRARCLEFVVLTGVRTNEALGATWDEIKDDGVWVIPATRMKANKEHRVPLAARALEILDGLPRGGPYVYGGSKPLPETALRKQVLRRLRPGATVHGFRASFRTWCDEATSYPHHVVEQALGHTVGNSVERAYKRGDLFEKRRRLMSAWADYCAAPKAASDATVTRIREREHA
jgi:integrase